MLSGHNIRKTLCPCSLGKAEKVMQWRDQAGLEMGVQLHPAALSAENQVVRCFSPSVSSRWAPSYPQRRLLSRGQEHTVPGLLYSPKSA